MGRVVPDPVKPAPGAHEPRRTGSPGIDGTKSTRDRRWHHHQYPPVPGGGELGEGVAQVGCPVAIAPVERYGDAPSVQFRTQRGEEPAALIVDRAPAAEEVVVLATAVSRSRGIPRPRVTFSRKGRTSSAASGPPNETSMTAS